ncbi:MAG: ribosome assembly cofactor RimP [Bacteroidales bacterium]|nr:ribosome assembly cofactor RimP [Bacteroidales bacterium]
MISAEQVVQAAQAALDAESLYIVEVKVAPGNIISVVVDADGPVGIDACIALSRHIEGQLDREQEDFELSVLSSGIGQPLLLARQYAKRVGRQLEVLRTDGQKLQGELIDVTPDGVGLRYTAREAVEGKKRKQEVVHETRIPFADIKRAHEVVPFR